MDLDWKDFPDAPEPGAFLCELTEIPRGGVLSKTVDGFSVLVLIVKQNPQVFVNACPHQYLPLDHRDSTLLSSDGQHLICTNHQAMFRVTDGQGAAGEGLGCQLSKVPSVVIGNSLHIEK